MLQRPDRPPPRRFGGDVVAAQAAAVAVVGAGDVLLGGAQRHRVVGEILGDRADARHRRRRIEEAALEDDAEPGEAAARDVDAGLADDDIFTAYVPMPSYSTVPVAMDSVSCGNVNCVMPGPGRRCRYEHQSLLLGSGGGWRAMFCAWSK